MMNLTKRAQVLLKDIKETMVLNEQVIDLAANDRKKEMVEIIEALEEIGKRIMISLPNLTNEIKLDEIDDELDIILEEIGRMFIMTYEDYEDKKYDPNKNKEMLKEVLEEEEVPYVEACMFLMEYAYNKR